MTTRSWLPWFVLLVVPVLYTALIARFGWSQGDDGFILAYSWRIFNGELPYRDFVYVRPPLSPFLHTAYFYFIPESYLYLFSRFFVALQIGVYSLLSAQLLRSVTVTPFLSDASVRHWAVVGFLLSATVFTLIPWHTVDGIFFAVLSLYCLMQTHRMAAVLAALLLLASALTKQSFYPLLLLFPLLPVVERRYIHSAIFIATLLAGVGAICTMPSSAQLAHDFHQLTQGISTINDAVQAGIVSYIKSPLRLIVATILISVTMLGLARWRKVTLQPWHYWSALIVVAVVLSCYMRLHYGDKFNHRRLGLMHLLLLLNVAAIFTHYFRGQWQYAARLAGLTAIAWCASISWGMQTPALFATPLIIGAFAFAHGFGAPNDTEVKRVQTLTFIGFFIIAMTFAWQPYRDLTRAKLHCNIGKVSDKLTGIVTNAQACEKLQEAKTLTQRFHQQVTFLPSFDLAYFLFHLRNPLPLDWPMQAELANASERVNDALAHDVRFAIVDIEAAQNNQEIGADDRFYVPLMPVVQQQWHKIESGRFYEVYANPAYAGVHE